ncbi:baseplate wedge subunit [Klebsiella phage CPRSA]|nr:baseplate wedge subunit [Klebsiella phage CPRSA]
MGITMLTVFINSGLSMTHNETIIDILRNYRFDSGYPAKFWPDRIASMDGNGNQQFDLVTGEPLYTAHPRAGNLLMYLRNMTLKKNLLTVFFLLRDGSSKSVVRLLRR